MFPISRKSQYSFYLLKVDYIIFTWYRQLYYEFNTSSHRYFRCTSSVLTLLLTILKIITNTTIITNYTIIVFGTWNFRFLRSIQVVRIYVYLTIEWTNGNWRWVVRIKLYNNNKANTLLHARPFRMNCYTFFWSKTHFEAIKNWKLQNNLT